MFVKVFKLEDEENALATFANGYHVIGRGTDLQCNDKRVSRNHATLEVNKNHIKITSTHINPCYIKMEGSKTITLLSKDSSKELNDGDAFAFLPDEFWFKIKIFEENLPVVEETEEKHGVKRELNSSDEEPEEKKRKVEEPTKEENKEDNDKEEVPSSSDAVDSNNIKQEIDDNVDNNSSSDEQANSNNEVKNEEKTDVKEEDQEDPPTSTNPQPRPRRDRCWYGAGCYRKNPGHKSEFTHPGDSDYESDPDDKRPSCSYGAMCYRKNKDHRRNYKHPSGGPPSKEKKKRSRKKVDRLNVADYGDSDLSDLSEDPFEVDGDSDEYVQDSDNDDSDWEDSQDLDEDSENVKRLVREAKRFTKK